MSIATVLPIFLPQFCDSNGAPVSGGKLYSYTAGTTTPQALYTTAALTPGTEFSNPLILGSDGRPSGPVYLKTTPAYKFRLDDANGVTIIPTTDSIIAFAPAS